MNNRFLADSYLFAPHFATQTLLGSSRSIGLEQVEVLIPNCKDQCLATAWLDYLNHCYSEAFLKEWLGVRGVWEKERYGFDWGYCIYGNPFDRLGLQSPPPQSQKKRSVNVQKRKSDREVTNNAQRTTDLALVSKKTNWVIANRLVDATGQRQNIKGIYLSSAVDRQLRLNQKIDWGKNFISKPVPPGEYAAMSISTETTSSYDVRINFDGTDSTGASLCYFHKSVTLYPVGTIVHQAIHSLIDNSSPWKITPLIDERFSE